MTYNPNIFVILLQADLSKRLPTFDEIVKYYGPYLGLVIVLIIGMLIMQYIWFRRIVKSKDEEIKRLTSHEQVLVDRILNMIDKEIGFKKTR